MKHVIAFFALLACLPSDSLMAVEISGYYKNLLLSSRTFIPPPESYYADLNRLRLIVDGELNKNVGFHLEYDNEILLGNYLDTTQFSQQKARPVSTYWDLDQDYADNQTVYGRHLLYRGYFRLSLDQSELRLGRQRINWATARMWNPMDTLNPWDPTQLERDQRTGVDAAVWDWDYDALSRLSLVYAPEGDDRKDNFSSRWRTNIDLFDVAVMAGRFRDGRVLGADFSGQLGNVGVRGELTHSRSEIDGAYNRMVLGADYTFGNTLSLNLELYFNGQGERQSENYDVTRLQSGQIQSLARRYVGFYLGYEFTPLLRWDQYLIINVDDDSRFFYPVLAYSIGSNLEWQLGAQLFDGISLSEYGRFEDVYYNQLQWFF